MHIKITFMTDVAINIVGATLAKATCRTFLVDLFQTDNACEVAINSLRCFFDCSQVLVNTANEFKDLT
jgi:hypothetical protein